MAGREGGVVQDVGGAGAGGGGGGGGVLVGENLCGSVVVYHAGHLIVWFGWSAID